MRTTMGHFATGVTVVSAKSRAGLFGSTANAISSVSLDPPLVLVCLQRDSVTLRALLEARCFGLSVLGEAQGWIARLFSRPSTTRHGWSEVAHRRGVTGAPLLDPAVATVEAVVYDLIEAGDHQIVLGQVLALDHPETHVSPLIFYRGAFGGLSDR